MSSKSTQLLVPSQPLNAGIRIYPRFSRFNAIIAVACTIILLIGGIIGLQILHQGKSKPGPAASPEETASIYAITNAGNYYRLDPTTHNVLWSRSTPLISYSTIIAKNGLLYTFGSANGETIFYALNPSDGSIRWSTPVLANNDPNLFVSLGGSGGPIITNDMVYFATFSASQGYSMIHALSAMTGKEVWQYRMDITPIAVTGKAKHDVPTGITLQAATSDVLYITHSYPPGTMLYALDVKHQGQELWHKTIMADNLSDSRAVIINGVLCLSSIKAAVNTPKILYGYDASTGEQKWSVQVRDEMNPMNHLVEANGILYIGTGQIQSQGVKQRASYNKGAVYALRPQDGSILWHYTTQGRASDPVIKDGIVYFTSSLDNGDSNIPLTVTALDATTGQLRWSQDVPESGGYNFWLVASNNFLYLPLSNNNGEVKVFHIPDGKPAGSFSVPVKTFDGPFTLTIVP